MRSDGAVVLRGLDQRDGVLGKAGAAIARPGVQEFRADAVVETDSARDLLDIGADLLAQVRHLVDEGDLGREEAVGGVFDHLRGAAIGEHDRRRVEVERTIEVRKHFAGAAVIGADDDPVGMLEVLDRRAFAQEFRIGDDRHGDVRPQLAQNPFDLVAGSDRHRRFGDDDRRLGQQRCKLTGRGVDERQIGVAVAAPRRRADRDEHRIGLADGCQVGREGKPTLLPVGGDQVGEPGLVDRDFALIERRDLARRRGRRRSRHDRNPRSRPRRRARRNRYRSSPRA